MEFCLLAFSLVVGCCGDAFCHGPTDSEAQYGYGYHWEIDPVMRQAVGSGYLHGPGWDISVPGWYSMSREDTERLQQMRDAFQKDTLELRTKLIVKQMALTTLWAQPNMDMGAAEKLVDEVADLQAEFGKKRGRHLLNCRKQFGGDNWTCPGIWMTVKSPE
jgi:hypothetical protein